MVQNCVGSPNHLDHILLRILPQDFVECRNVLIERGQQYTNESQMSREKIGQLAARFIRDGVVRVQVILLLILVLTSSLYSSDRFDPWIFSCGTGYLFQGGTRGKAIQVM